MVVCEEHSSCVIVFTSKKCPVCVIQDEINDLSQENCDLQAEVDDFNQYWMPKP